MHNGELWLENRRGSSGLGIGEARPRLSWLLPDCDEQTVVLRATSAQGRAEVVAPTQGRLLGWPFRPLASRDRVEVSLHRLSPAPDADPLVACPVEAGLLQTGDWHEEFVSPSPKAKEQRLRPAFLLRAEWDLSNTDLKLSDVARARVYSTAHGVYELEVNGRAVGSDVLAPGWTSYRHRLRYQTHDVTDLVRDGRNAIGAWLADGWYRGRIGFEGGRWDYYGQDVALLASGER